MQNREQKQQVYQLLISIRRFPDHGKTEMSLDNDGRGALWHGNPFCRKCDKYKLFAWNDYTEATEKLTLYLTNLGAKYK